ncbi:hypothetical protein [Haloprofundus salinisoli]|uniref:hypothetical protein n=1 Tax=Haloprofundus salinisoli TaxID=2876193 RepID=UPI001CCE8BE4|nr:hypothetical protein [Haloprofundus salinisoli]
MLPTPLHVQGATGLNGPISLEVALVSLGFGAVVLGFVAYDAYRAYGEYDS